MIAMAFARAGTAAGNLMARMALVALLLLAGCAFSPMYSNSAGGQSAIGPVAVQEIEGLAGHTLKRELDRLLAVENAGAVPLQLEIGLAESVAGTGYRVDESTTRAVLNLSANYILRYPDGEVTRGSVWTHAVYDIPASAYGEVAAQNDARERAAEALARRMRAELAIRIAQRRRS